MTIQTDIAPPSEADHAELVGELKSAFDANNPALKNLALRKAHDALSALTHRVKELEEGKSDLVRANIDLLERCRRLEATSAQNQQMRTAMEEARRDAERYRFLRSRNLDTIHAGGVFAGKTPDNVVLNEEDLDAAIDAALSLTEESR